MHKRRFDVVTVQAPMQPIIGALFETIYAPLLEPLYHQCVDWILSVTEDTPFYVIDIGCGPGALADILLERSRNLSWVGVEPSAYFARKLSKKVKQSSDRAIVYQESAETFDFHRYPGAVVVSLGSIKHWTDPLSACQAIKRCAPRGLWISEVCSQATPVQCKAFVNPSSSWLRRAVAWQFEHRIVPRGIEATTLQRVLEQSGLRPHAIEHSGPFVLAVSQWK